MGEFSEPRTATQLPMKRTVLEDKASSENGSDGGERGTAGARTVSLLVAGHLFSQEHRAAPTLSSSRLTNGPTVAVLTIRETARNVQTSVGSPPPAGQSWVLLELESLGTVAEQTPVTLFNGGKSGKEITCLQTHFGVWNGLRNPLKLVGKAGCPSLAAHLVSPQPVCPHRSHWL